MDAVESQIEDLKAAGEYVKSRDILQKLEKIKQQFEADEYLVAFMGQFSAGKSCLLNNLLQRDILPVHKKETTPIITLIRYGIEEKAVITYKDKRQQQIDLSEVKNIWQEGEAVKKYKVMDIANVEVRLDNDLLNAGLIIADTPGVNTLIEGHEEITLSLLSSVEELFYVTAKSVTQTDVEFLNRISLEGIRLSVVRTHMDLIKSEEEDVGETVEIETNLFKQYTNNGGHIYFVSNENDSVWYAGIDEIKHYIGKEISANIRENVNTSCQKRLNMLVESLRTIIAEKVAVLQKEQMGNQDALREEYKKSKNAMANIESVLSKKIDSIERNTNEILQQSKEDLNRTKAQVIRAFNDTVDDLPVGENIYEELRHKSANEIDKAAKQLGQAYATRFNAILEKFNQECLEENCMAQYSPDGNVPMLRSLEDMIDYHQRKNYVLNAKQNELQIRKARLEQLQRLDGSNQAKYEEELVAIEEQLVELKQFMEEMGPYEPVYIERPGDDSMSRLFRGIGMAADIALMLVPGGQISGAAKAAGATGKGLKALQIFNKAKKVGTFTKVLSGIKNGAQKIATVKNKAQDVAQKTDMLDLLDYLQLEYWGEKLGKQFDTPPRREEDMEYKQKFFEEQNQRMLAYRKEISHKIDIQRKLGKIKDEQQAKVEEARMLQESEAKLKEDIERLRGKSFDSALRKFVIQTKDDWKLWFSDRVEDVCHDIEKNYRPLFMRGLKAYTEEILEDNMAKNKDLQERLELLEKDMKSLTEGEINQEIVKGQEFLKKLAG